MLPRMRLADEVAQRIGLSLEGGDVGLDISDVLGE